MGLAASQARLLLLTARKSDLEYRAQCITQRKLILAMQTEELATNYSKALNARKLSIAIATDQNNSTVTKKDLTYSSLTYIGNATRYRVVDRSGNIVALNETDAQKYVSTLTDVAITVNPSTGEQAIDPVADTYNASAKFNLEYADMLDNPDVFQQLLQSGVLFIEELSVTQGQDIVNADGTTSEVQVNNWTKKSLSEISYIYNEYDSAGMAEAEAEYNASNLLIQNQDKQLDVELKQIETQQKACETEIDSVKKVLTGNIEKSFKTFA